MRKPKAHESVAVIERRDTLHHQIVPSAAHMAATLRLRLAGMPADHPKRAAYAAQLAALEAPTKPRPA